MQVVFDHSKDEAANITTFFFRPEKPVQYTAGQFIELTIPHENPDDRGQKRWFTLSSSPTDEVSGAFLDAYGAHLSAEQAEVMRQARILYVDQETSEVLTTQWDQGTRTLTENSVLNNRHYVAYQVAEALLDGNASPHSVGGQWPWQFWAGRFATYPLVNRKHFPLDPSWLMSQDDYHLQGERGFYETESSLGSFVYTNARGADMLHEKVHMIQDPELPLPVLEAAAYFYQKDIYAREGWFTVIWHNMDRLADRYGECVTGLGDDVHKLLFGNLDASRKQEVLAAVNSYFDEEFLDRLAKENSPGEHVTWHTQPVE